MDRYQQDQTQLVKKSTIVKVTKSKNENLGVRVNSEIIDSLKEIKESKGISRTEFVESALKDKLYGNMSEDLKLKLKIANSSIEELELVFASISKRTGNGVKRSKTLSVSMSYTDHNNFKKFAVLCNMSMADTVRTISNDDKLQNLLIGYIQSSNKMVLSKVTSEEKQKMLNHVSLNV